MGVGAIGGQSLIHIKRGAQLSHKRMRFRLVEEWNVTITATHRTGKSDLNTGVTVLQF